MKCVVESYSNNKNVDDFVAALFAPEVTMEAFRISFLDIFRSESMKKLKDITRNGLSAQYLSNYESIEIVEVTSKPVNQILGISKQKVMFGNAQV